MHASSHAGARYVVRHDYLADGVEAAGVVKVEDAGESKRNGGSRSLFGL